MEDSLFSHSPFSLTSDLNFCLFTAHVISLIIIWAMHILLESGARGASISHNLRYTGRVFMRQRRIREDLLTWL